MIDTPQKVEHAEQETNTEKMQTQLSTDKRKKSKVQFHGVEIREYARVLGDNPSATGGAPLGLDWTYQRVERNRISGRLFPSNDSSGTVCSGSSEVTPEDNEATSAQHIIPIDEYERITRERCRSRLLKILKLQKKAQKQKSSKQTTTSRAVQRKAKSNSDTITITEERDELSEEQIKQLGARWLKLHPIPIKQREKMLMEETDLSKKQINTANRELAKVRQQRRSTIAMTESGLDDFQVVVEFFARRFRRLRVGISKKREQELLWENAGDYWQQGVQTIPTQTQHFDKANNCATRPQRAGSDATSATSDL